MQNTPPILIDETAHIRFLNRAAGNFDSHGFLKQTVAERIVDRLDAIRRRFSCVIDVGCHTGVLAKMLAEHPSIDRVIAFDTSPAMVMEARARGVNAIVASANSLPLADESVDAVFSAFSLHWMNDLPGVMMKLRRLLKPDGLMIIALAGGVTLEGWRNCLAEAETEIAGGLSPRVLPMADIRDLGGLLSRAGLALPVADSDTITISWPDAFALMHDLRGMAEQNALADRSRRTTSRQVFLHAAALAGERLATDKGQISENVEIITLTGWAPHESQQQPLKPGSAQNRLANVLTPDKDEGLSE
jgi:SAM-dependent methyltransferase